MTLSLDLGAMLAGATSLVQAQSSFRASVQAARIIDKPVSIALRRNGVNLAAQMVRLEYDDTVPSDAVSDAGAGFAKRGVLFGTPSLDVDTWDTFVWDEQEFTVLHVNRSLIGQTQCDFEAVGS